MPGIVLPALTGAETLQTGFDNNLSAIGTYLTGQVPGTDIATAGVRREAFPRPAIINALHAAYGETQDVFGVGQVKADPGALGDRPQGRQDIFGSMLDPQGRVRLQTLMWKGRVPRYSRLLIHAGWSAVSWRNSAAVYTSVYGGYFVLRVQEPGQASVVLAGTRRDAPRLASGGTAQAPHTALGWFTPTAANAAGQIQIWAEYDRDGSDFFTQADPNGQHMVIGNANMVVRCFKDYP